MSVYDTLSLMLASCTLLLALLSYLDNHHKK